MDADRLVHYIKNPAHLYQVSYTELKSLVLQYPYCQNLRYLLLKKSILENHKEKEQNLQLAATYSNDRPYLYQQIKDKDSFNSEVDSFVLKEDYLELKSIAPTKEESPILPESNAEPVVIEPEHVEQLKGTEAFPAEEIDEIEAEDTFLEEPPTEDLSTVVDSALVTPANELNTLEEEDFEDITDEFDDLFIEDLLGIEPSNAVTDSENPVPPPAPEPKKEDDAISIDELIALDNMTPLQRMEKKRKDKSKTEKADKKEKEFDIENIDALIEETKKDVKSTKSTTQSNKGISPKNNPEKTSKSGFKNVFDKMPPPEFDSTKETFILPEPKKSKKSKKQKKKSKTADLSLLKKKAKKESTAKELEKPKKIADKSLRDSDDIASETLAKLLIDQENYSKAIEMYERLSLKFPEKSSFFAEQIENLKKL